MSSAPPPPRVLDSDACVGPRNCLLTLDPAGPVAPSSLPRPRSSSRFHNDWSDLAEGLHISPYVHVPLPLRAVLDECTRLHEEGQLTVRVTHCGYFALDHESEYYRAIHGAAPPSARWIRRHGTVGGDGSEHGEVGGVSGLTVPMHHHNGDSNDGVVESSFMMDCDPSSSSDDVLSPLFDSSHREGVDDEEEGAEEELDADVGDELDVLASAPATTRMPPQHQPHRSSVHGVSPEALRRLAETSPFFYEHIRNSLGNGSHCSDGANCGGNLLAMMATCAVCADDLDPAACLRAGGTGSNSYGNNEGDVWCLPCGHVYHFESCILQWFQRSRHCPTCRFEVTSESIDAALQCAYWHRHTIDSLCECGGRSGGGAGGSGNEGSVGDACNGAGRRGIGIGGGNGKAAGPCCSWSEFLHSHHHTSLLLLRQQRGQGQVRAGGGGPL